MRHRTWPVPTALACACLAMGWVLSPFSAQQPTAQEAPASDVFGLTKVHAFHLELSAKEWERMQAVIGGKMFPGGPGGPKKIDKPALNPGADPIEYHKNSGFGTQFPWAHADLSAAGKTYKNVAMRYKGNASYMATAGGLKRNLKIELDHDDTDLRFHGLKTITLNAGGMDPLRMREALAYAVFRAAGVPAPRTAFVQLTLTVPDKYDKEFVGLYTFIEHVDKTFLKERFKNGKGLLMKPERLRGIDYLGDDWARYKDRYQPKREPSKKEARRVIDFAKLVNLADDEQFKKQIASFVDVDEFLRFTAVNALIVNLDSFFTLGHNYYIYLNPTTNQFVFMPWDLDLSFAGMPMGGAAEQQMDLSLMHPYPGQHKLADRLLAIPAVNEKYGKILKELTSSCFTKEKLLADIDAIEKATREILVREKNSADARKEVNKGFGPPGGGPFGRATDLRSFVEKRTASITAQLAGNSKGYVPVMGFGPGGPKGGFGPGMFMARPLLEALDTDKDGKVSKAEFLVGARKFFTDCDKDNQGKLDEKAFADGFQRIMPPPPGFGPPKGGFPGGPGGKFGFGPGKGLANNVMKRADTDKDGLVTLDEFMAAAAALFKQCDKDDRGKLDESAVAAGINLLFPPPGFGPPGFGPPDKGPPPPKKEKP